MQDHSRADPTTWGPLAWNLKHDIVRAAVRPIFFGLSTQDNGGGGGHLAALNGLTMDWQSERGQMLLQYLNLLGLLYSCGTCRTWYAKDIATPEHTLENATNLLVWLWELKARVNEKLGHTTLPLEQYEKRWTLWTSFGSVDGLWDFLILLAGNFPENNSENANMIKRAYFVWLGALCYFLRELPTYSTTVPFLDPLQVFHDKSPLKSRQNFLEFMQRQRDAWYGERGGLNDPKLSKKEMTTLTMPSDNNSDGASAETTYTCPNPALLNLKS